MSDGERMPTEPENINLNNSENAHNIENNVNNDNEIRNDRNDIPHMENNGQNNQQTKIDNKFTLTFICVTLIRFVIYAYQYYYSFSVDRYTFQYWPIINKHQYYRMITHHFLSSSFLTLLLESYILFKIIILLEKSIGTFLSFVYILINIILISFANLIVIFFLKIFIQIIQFVQITDYNFDYESGLTPLLLNIYSFVLLMTSFREHQIFFLRLLNLKRKQIPWIIFFILKFITPNTSTFGNFNGILTANIFFYLAKNIFPDLKMIVYFETVFKLNKFNNKIYRGLDFKDRQMRHSLKGLYKDKYDNLKEKEDSNVGTEMNDVYDMENTGENNARNNENQAEVLDQEINNN